MVLTILSVVQSFAADESNDNTLVNKSEISTYSTAENKVYKVAPFTYGIIDSSTDMIINNSGESLSTETLSLNNNANARTTYKWDDVFITVQQLYEDYHFDDWDRKSGIRFY